MFLLFHSIWCITLEKWQIRRLKKEKVQFNIKTIKKAFHSSAEVCTGSNISCVDQSECLAELLSLLLCDRSAFKTKIIYLSTIYVNFIVLPYLFFFKKAQYRTCASYSWYVTSYHIQARGSYHVQAYHLLIMFKRGVSTDALRKYSLLHQKYKFKSTSTCS